MNKHDKHDTKERDKVLHQERVLLKRAIETKLPEPLASSVRAYAERRGMLPGRQGEQRDG